MTTSSRDLARRIAVRRRQRGPIERHQGIVTATDAGPPPTISVRIDDSPEAIAGIRYMSSYAPTVGDTVEIIIDETDVLVLGKLAS